MEDTQGTTQPVEPVESTQATTPATAEPVQPTTPVAEVAPSEESFLRKNKMLIIGGIVGLIVITVAVGILLSLKNSEKLEGMIKIQKDYIQTQEHSVKIPRTRK